MDQFEYQIITVASSGWFSSGDVDYALLQRRMNELGREGWELVSVEDTNRHDGGTKDLVLFMKRRIA